ncbi:DUF5709 domain-containing protein [Microtetraspora sp. NBRC 16547]|uniref:DUF5709 domain-containing protein n=1 Tax=Microtetraspora sp. NBRC 16547 TaxID=3030993 RepID=UPI00255218D2|nr:DUF5709 domain-containing protein [Microtetraspora sp. NBRC 16547]
MTQHTRPEPDPRSRAEDEGIPDLREGTPEREWAHDPQEEPIPAESPVGIDECGTTSEEMARGEPLDMRLRREVPDKTLLYGSFEDAEPAAADERVPYGGEEDTGYPEDARRPTGRLVDPDEGVRADVDQQMIGEDVGPDVGGYGPEETAMRIEPE